MNWNEFEQECKNCRKCGLCDGRTNVVIGRGNPNADILFVGEGPGEQEDLQGQPFVGKAGQLFELCLDTLNFDRSRIYIANVVKCRPPQNRNPFPEECLACLPFLRTQFSLIRPKIVVCMGKTAASTLLHKNDSVQSIRGHWENVKGTWFLVTYHPAALLREEKYKLPFRSDLESVQKKLREIDSVP